MGRIPFLVVVSMLIACEGSLFVTPGTGPVFDGGPGFDGGPPFDGGPAFDGGPVFDGGPAFDGGPVFDGGPPFDSAPVYDAGPAFDGGPTSDAGPRDAGDDAGPPFDAGPPPFDAGPPDMCSGGPLAEPIAGCRPAPLPSTGDHAEDCVRRINQFRAECQCLPPLARWTAGESCATEHAEYDSTRSAHAGFRDRICTPGGRGQNECPGYPSEGSIVSTCLQQMWDEGPGEPFSAHGHYINMTNPAHSMVACGIFIRPDGRVWAVQNFQ